MCAFREVLPVCLPFARLLLRAGLAVVAAAAGLGAQTVDDVRRAYGAEPPERVEAVLQGALRAAPAAPELLLFAAEMRADRGQLAEAETLLRRVVAMKAPPAAVGRAHVLLGRVRYQADDAEGARAQLDSARAGGVETAQVAAWYLHLFGLDRAYEGWRTAESEHLRLHVQPDAEIDPDEYLRSREAALTEIQGFFQAKLPRKIDIYMWRSADDARATGLEGVPFARPLLSLVHARPGLSRGRELTRVVAYWAAVPWRTTRLVGAGTAVAFDLNPADRLANAREALRLAGLTTASVQGLWEDQGAASEALMHAVGALVVRRLIDEGGRERFLAFLPDQSWGNARRVYGDTLTQIVAGIERDLAAPADTVAAPAATAPANTGAGGS